MPNYRRHRLPGGTYFFTVNLLERKSTLLTEHIAELREAVRLVREQRPFHIDGWVVLPDHLHAIWTLPLGDVGYPERWREIKKAFSKSIPKTEYRSNTRIKRRELGVWQRRYWEHTIRDEEDYATHMDYLHYNPVKHGWVQSVKEWPYSSFHHLVEKGVYLSDWGGSNLAMIDARETVVNFLIGGWSFAYPPYGSTHCKDSFLRLHYANRSYGLNERNPGFRYASYRVIA